MVAEANETQPALLVTMRQEGEIFSSLYGSVANACGNIPGSKQQHILADNVRLFVAPVI